MSKGLEILLLTGCISKAQYAALKKHEKIMDEIHKGEGHGKS